MNLRIGHGYDVHQLKEGLPLVIGGECIPSEKGIVAHSDGDVLLHVIIDSILGATNLGDIGQLFPNDNKWKNVSGIDMLEITLKHIQKHYSNFKILNIDTTIILEKPKILKFKDSMKKNIAHTLNIDEQKISIKATTTDYLGYIGESKGWSVIAVSTIYSTDGKNSY